MSNCNECEYKLKCNVRALKEFRDRSRNEQDDAPIDREKVKALFEKKLAGTVN